VIFSSLISSNSRGYVKKNSHRLRGIPGISATILHTLILDGELDCLLSSSTRGVSHCGLEKVRAKEELWKFKYFTLQKYSL